MRVNTEKKERRTKEVVSTLEILVLAPLFAMLMNSNKGLRASERAADEMYEKIQAKIQRIVRENREALMEELSDEIALIRQYGSLWEIPGDKDFLVGSGRRILVAHCVIRSLS